MKPIILVILGAGIFMHLVHQRDHTADNSRNTESKIKLQQQVLSNKISDSAKVAHEATFSIQRLP